MNLTVEYYTLQKICELYDYILQDLSINPCEIESHKYNSAIIDLLGVVIIKFKKKLLDTTKSNETFKIKLKNYQAYFLADFLFKYKNEFKGLYEQNTLYNIASKIDEQL